MKKRFQKALAGFLTLALLFSVLPGGLANATFRANAAQAKAGAQNLIADPGFEDTDHSFVTNLPVEPVPGRVGNWHQYKEVEKAAEQPHSGDYAAKIVGGEASLEQDVDNLTPGATYTYKIWVKNTAPSGNRLWIGVKNYGGSEKKVLAQSSEYQEYSISFTMGANNTKARVYVWLESGNQQPSYLDDASLVKDADVADVTVENGRVDVQYSEGFAGSINPSDFTLQYVSSAAPETVVDVTPTGSQAGENSLSLAFAPVAAIAIDQTIDFTVTYTPKNESFTKQFSVAASGGEIVEANLASVSAENGKLTATLDADPTVRPVQDDFTVSARVDDAAFEALSISNFSYDSASKTAELSFAKIAAGLTDKAVTIKVVYAGAEKTASFTVAKAEGTVYYVDSVNGDDSFDGQSPETAFRSIEKVNTIQFMPGDQLLFKAGCEWTGALKPQGSGIEGKPILIDRYGEGDRPVLKPGADWTQPYFNSNKNFFYNKQVNNVITFYNQSYWEVRNLELFDPQFDSINPRYTYTFRRGILVSAEDIGTMTHLYFDNLYIHGFRGPNNNDGKSAGGIIFNIYSTPYDPSARVRTNIDDVRITNCELAQLGRSGINYITPWTTKTGEKWANFDYVGLGEWMPYTNFYIANNIFHDIDGDGAIIDNNQDTIVEHNIVYTTAKNCDYAVGLFPWNSKDIIFQYNEVYDIQRVPGDGQGIEIDAINENIYVQYNYLHDNAGGFLLWCSTDTLPSYNGVYRYNISQNDNSYSGFIDWRVNHHGSMAYNNTIYMGAGTTREFMRNDANRTADAKFYNNIFYNEGGLTSVKFNESNIDWEGNLFYGFDKLPGNDSKVIQADPKLVAPGTGAYGIDSVGGYKLQAGSPAIDAGVVIQDNGGQDYFGTPLTDGKPDIGAAEYVPSGPVVDKDALQAVVDEANALQEADYTAESWTDMQAKLSDAQDILDDPAVEQAAVDAAKDALRAAIDALVPAPVVDKDALQAVVDEANALQEADYTAESWTDMQAKLSDAQGLLDSPAAEQTAVDAAKDALRAAIDALVPVPVVDRPILSGMPANGASRAAVTITADREVTFFVNGEEAGSGRSISLRVEGAYDLYAVDAEGVESEHAVFVIDRTKPVLTASEEHLSTVNRDVVLTASEEVVFTVNGVEVYTGTSYTLTEDGVQTVKIADKAGNGAAAYRVTIDKTAPVLTGVPADGVTRGSVSLCADSRVQYIVNGVVAADFEYRLRVIEDGAYTVEAVDQAGNSTTVSFTVDRTKPTFTANAQSGVKVAHDVTITASETVNFVISGEVVSTGTAYTISDNGVTTVYVYDIAGNYGGGFRAVIDKQAPVLTATYEGTHAQIQNGAAVASPVTIRSDKKAVFTVNGVQEEEASLFVKLRTPGSYEITAMDEMGNVSEIFTITVKEY